MVYATPRPLYPRERDTAPTVQEAGWAPGPVWTGAENLAPTGIRSPDRPARSESLYRLSYPGPFKRNQTNTNTYHDHMSNITTGKERERGLMSPKATRNTTLNRTNFPVPSTKTKLVLLALLPFPAATNHRAMPNKDGK